MNVIEISHITKDYGQNRGVFDVSFSVKQGEVLGFLGPNGAGKTTTIRQLMGFIKPDKADCPFWIWTASKSRIRSRHLLGICRERSLLLIP